MVARRKQAGMALRDSQMNAHEERQRYQQQRWNPRTHD